MSDFKPLRLLAEDADDLKIVSAALQDAVAKVGDARWEPAARRFTVALNRYRWEAGRKGGGERVRAALQLGSVLAVKARNVRREARDAVVELLAVRFEPSGLAEDPGGAIVLELAGGGDIRVEVEAIDAVLADVSEPWPTPRTPRHEV